MCVFLVRLCVCVLVDAGVVSVGLCGCVAAHARAMYNVVSENGSVLSLRATVCHPGTPLSSVCLSA